jgi:hypothetical protein
MDMPASAAPRIAVRRNSEALPTAPPHPPYPGSDFRSAPVQISPVIPCAANSCRTASAGNAAKSKNTHLNPVEP